MGIAREAVRARVAALRDESRGPRGAFVPSYNPVAPSPQYPSSPSPHSLTAAPIRYLELDVTEDCVLRCSYCFRRNKQPHRMSWDTAKAAVDWFMEASGDQNRVSIYFFGGEPLMCFDLIKEVVPYAEREAAKRGKRVHCGATTNAVLVNEEVIQFWREHGMSFNTSIDGAPECHDRFRRFPDGRGSYAYVERGVRQVLAYRPQTTARCTLHPENAHRALESVLNLMKIGYDNIPLIAIDDCPWTEAQYAVYREQLAKLSDLFIARYRQGKPIYLKHLDTAIRGIVNPRGKQGTCGAGRSMLLVNHEGDIYPCHRFPGYDEEGRWRLGSIFEPEKFNHDKRAEFLNYDARNLKADCDHCLAVNICSSTCLAVNWDLHKDLYRPSPVHCRLFRVYFEEGLRVHHVLKTENNAGFMRQYYRGRRGALSPQRPRRTARPIRKPGIQEVVVGVGTTVVSTQESLPGPLCAYTGFDEAEYTSRAARRRVEQASRLPHSVVPKRFHHPSRLSLLATRSWPCAESVVSGRRVVLCEPEDVRVAARAPSFAVGESAMPCCDPACDPCEGCQEPCEVACEGCEDPCQVGCETSCQICANAQEVCCEQCDWPCETTCQGCETCEEPCETTCDPCDTPCETACQPCEMCEPCEGCEVVCDTCESPCDPCEVCQTCQPACDQCETACQGCGTVCENQCEPSPDCVEEECCPCQTPAEPPPEPEPAEGPPQQET